MSGILRDETFAATVKVYRAGGENSRRGGQSRSPRPSARAEDAELDFQSAAMFDGRTAPFRRWIVAGLIPGDTVTMLGGDGGTGKSLLALQAAFAVATGGAWLGHKLERNGPAMFLSAEDDRDELHRRLSDISEAEGVSLADASQLHFLSLAGRDALLAMLDRNTNTLKQTPLFGLLDAKVAAIRPALLVLDTLADLHAGEENDRSHARQFIGLLRGLAIRHGCAVLLLAHPSLSGMASGSGLSGSTAWNASVRSRLYLTRAAEEGREQDPDRRLLRIVKSNYARTGDEIALRWQDGVFVAEKARGRLDRQTSSAMAERVFMSLLRQFADQGRDVNAKAGPNFAPAIFAGHPKSEGVTRRAFRMAMESLLSAGRIRNEDTGPPSRRTSRIVEVAP